MNKSSKIYIAGHSGMVGSAITRRLKVEGFNNIVTRSSVDLDLTNQKQVAEFFDQENPDFIFLAAAKVGGILANSQYKADFLYLNMMIQNNIIHQAYNHKVKKLLFLGSSCIYPRDAINPLKEDSIMTGSLEKTNEAYAIAKISGIKMCEFYREQYGCNFISVMPTNLYGPNDNYNLKTSHLIPALLRKFYEAKIKNESKVEIWGDGSPMREFLHVDDCANACVFLMRNYNDMEIVNIGSGVEYSIKEVAAIIQEKVGFSGGVVFNTSYPNGVLRKLLDVSKIHKLGWHHSIDLEEGIDRVLINLQSDLKKYI